MSNTGAHIFSNLDRLRAETMPTMNGTPRRNPKRINGEFLKGPIPLAWLTAAARLRGKAPLAVGLAIWFQSGRRKSKEIRLTGAVLARFRLGRKAKYRALAALENAGLIRVQRCRGKNPLVTVVDLPENTGQSA